MLAYIFQMMFCSAIMYGYYHFFMRNERFHQYNRFYLLSTIVLSLLLPLVKIPVTVKDDDFIYQSLNSWDNVLVTVTQKSPQYFTTSALLLIIYTAIAAIFIVRIILSLRKIYILKKNNPAEKMDDVSFIQTSHPDTPFSFFKWLFWNRSVELNSDKGRHIFRHEMYHIKKKHSWDLVFAELVTTFFWFNPIFFLIRREIKIIQEFLADKYASNQGNTASYAETLLMQTFGTNHQQLVNPFFHNQLKRRIVMLTKSKKTAYQYLRKLMVLPIVAVAIMLFAFTYNKEIKEVKQAVENKMETLDELIMPADVKLNAIEVVKAEIKDTVPKKKNAEVRNNITSADDEVETNSLNTVTVVGFYSGEEEQKKKVEISESEIFKKVEISASYPGGSDAWTSFLERNLRGETPILNGAKVGNYHVFIQFVVDKEGNVSRMKPLSSVGYGMEEEAMRVIQKSGKWRPAIFNGREVISYRKQPIVFQVLTIKKDESKENNIVKKPEPEPDIFTKAEIAPSFPGGADAWRNFLAKNLKGEIPVDHGAGEGNYTTIVQFIVDKDGTVSDVIPLTKMGFGMEEEAVRVIKKSGKWKPAIQNGRIVRAYHKQPITFQILKQ